MSSVSVSDINILPTQHSSEAQTRQHTGEGEEREYCSFYLILEISNLPPALQPLHHQTALPELYLPRGAEVGGHLVPAGWTALTAFTAPPAPPAVAP